MHTNLVICLYQQPGPGAVLTGRGETVHCTFISRTNETLTTTIQYSVQQGTRKLQANKYKPQLRNSTVQQITVHYPPLCNLPEGTFHHLSSCGPAGGLIRPDRGNRFNMSDQQSGQSGMMIPYETQYIQCIQLKPPHKIGAARSGSSVWQPLRRGGFSWIHCIF